MRISKTLNVFPGCAPRFRRYIIAALATVFFCAAFAAIGTALPQASQSVSLPTVFRVGERLTYNVSFGRFSSVAYGEVYVASRGRLADKDAVEIRAKFKTLDLVSAAFFLVDESRTTFASAESGLPLYTVRTQNLGGLPRETAVNYLAAPTSNVDLLTLIYKIRYSTGAGAVTLAENDKTYVVTFQSGATERVKTDAGEFDTSLISVQSDYFTEAGLKDLRINLSNDDSKLPVLVRFRAAKGEFKASLASIQIAEPDVDAPQPAPTPVKAPRQDPTPRPNPTPAPYIANQPLPPELAFDLGETLNYRLSAGGRPVGSFTLQARERRQFSGIDSLLLDATVTEIASGGAQVFAPGDYVRARVDPETLAPQQIDIKLSGPLSIYNRTVRFDKRGSVITFDGTDRVEAPIGTQSILSLLYALRSFNLKPSRNTSNPVNDTRVAVFWEKKPYIFTLRPSEAEIISVGGESLSSQLVSITTGNPQLDQLAIKIWLSNDERRVPLRFKMGQYEADLVSSAVVAPK